MKDLNFVINSKTLWHRILSCIEVWSETTWVMFTNHIWDLTVRYIINIIENSLTESRIWIQVIAANLTYKAFWLNFSLGITERTSRLIMDIVTNKIHEQQE